MSFPIKSKERRLQLDFIRNKGNFAHNSQVFEDGEGKLIPYKQPRRNTDGKEFMHCIHCYGRFCGAIFNPVNSNPKVIDLKADQESKHYVLLLNQLEMDLVTHAGSS
ncbi:hypothetical protein F7725_009593 [Dissostichus mawsoni]|uniref:Uncharacterized protein n=1 Tax=Dissostichus mawsoni TaxID=36200 RepID=A0A7J5XL62_DISMA|nr:hypothetical protein F7725_009593 [Dissostichus mawsoni]